MRIRNIFFDFDGVVAESVSAKTEAFREMYLHYGPEISENVVKFHIENGGISRYEKFKYWEKTFFNRIIDESEAMKMADKFSNLVLKKVIECEDVQGVKEFLERFHTKIKFFIITGTPTSEIQTILKERKIDKYFIEVCGSPKKKEYWTEHLIENHKLKRSETLFLGDATTDHNAARYSRLHFALREHEENQSIFKDFKGLKFKNFSDLEKEMIMFQMII